MHTTDCSNRNGSHGNNDSARFGSLVYRRQHCHLHGRKTPAIQLGPQAIMVVCGSRAGLNCRERTRAAGNIGGAVSRWTQAVGERL